MSDTLISILLLTVFALTGLAHFVGTRRNHWREKFEAWRRLRNR